MSDQMPDKLIEISCSEWTKLRDMYLIDWPTHMVGYYTVDNYVRWNNIKSNIKQLHIFSLNGDWQRDGTFVVVDRYQVFLNTLNNDPVEPLYRSLQLLDWTHGLKVSSFLARHRPAVLQVVNSKQLTMEFDSKTEVYYISRADGAALDVVCPAGISLRPMSHEHAVIANEVWPNRHQGSLFFLKRLIDWNPNVGAFTDDGKLVAWCLRLQAGPLGVLQVDSNHKQSGLGTLVTKAITKQLSDLDMDTFAMVHEDNIESRRMFQKVGFKVVDYSYWLRTDPLVETDWDALDNN